MGVGIDNSHDNLPAKFSVVWVMTRLAAASGRGPVCRRDNRVVQRLCTAGFDGWTPTTISTGAKAGDRACSAATTPATGSDSLRLDGPRCRGPAR